MIYAILTAGLIMTASLIGVVFSWRALGLWMETNMKYLVSFSAGVFLLVSINLAWESIELSSLWPALIYVALGYILFNFLAKLWPESHQHHQTLHHQEMQTIKSGAKKILAGDGIHNIGDGIVLAIAFATGPVVGFITALGILIHEAIQEISEFFILREAGYTVKQALWRNLVISATILPGLILGYYFSQTTLLITIILGLAAGAFLHISFHDLIPSVIKNSQEEKLYAKYALYALVGALVMISLTFLGIHGHEEDQQTNQTSRQDIH